MHAVFVHLNFPVGALDSEHKLDAVFELEDIFKETLETSGVGDFDGDEFCEGPVETSVTFFMYGPDANKIYQVVLPILMRLPSLLGSYITKRYGGLGAKETHIVLQ
jgi:hypothetical protein